MDFVLGTQYLEIRAIQLPLLCWTSWLQGHLTRIHLKNVMAVDYINHQGGIRSHAAQREVNLILAWAELHILTLTAMHILSVEHFSTNLLSF